jgi:hypothetical protein
VRPAAESLESLGFQGTANEPDLRPVQLVERRTVDGGEVLREGEVLDDPSRVDRGLRGREIQAEPAAGERVQRVRNVGIYPVLKMPVDANRSR